MSSVAFKQAKARGRWFEALVRPMLIEMGLEPEDSDHKKYSEKKGYDCLVRIKDKSGVYIRDIYGRVITERIEIKFDELSELTGNVAVDLDSINKSTAAIWIYGLPEGGQIHVYAMELRHLAPFAQKWPLKKPAGENHWVEVAVIPKYVFLSQPFIKKLKIINLN
jgi:hypothetical protein